jgi:hypothetical protein
MGQSLPHSPASKDRAGRRSICFLSKAESEERRTADGPNGTPLLDPALDRSSPSKEMFKDQLPCSHPAVSTDRK